jgi:hypothetical protein
MLTRRAQKQSRSCSACLSGNQLKDEAVCGNIPYQSVIEQPGTELDESTDKDEFHLSNYPVAIIKSLASPVWDILIVN